MPDVPLGNGLGFGRWFKELTAGEPQHEIARRLGYTQSRISQIGRGERPSREFVERVIQIYNTDREATLTLAGYGRKEEVDPIRQAAEIAAEAAARRVMDETLSRLGIGESAKSTPNQLSDRLFQAAAEHPEELTYAPDLESVSIDAFDGASDLSENDRRIVDRILRHLIQQRRQPYGYRVEGTDPPDPE